MLRGNVRKNQGGRISKINLYLFIVSIVHQLMKKSTLGPIVFSNYHLVSMLLFLGKVAERTVTGQLQAFLDHASILDPFKTHFCPGHGKESALVALTDDL